MSIRPSHGISALGKSERDIRAFSLSWGATVRRQASTSQKESTPRHQTPNVPAPDLGPQPPELWETNICCFKPPAVVCCHSSPSWLRHPVLHPLCLNRSFCFCYWTLTSILYPPRALDPGPWVWLQGGCPKSTTSWDLLSPTSRPEQMGATESTPWE